MLFLVKLIFRSRLDSREAHWLGRSSHLLMANCSMCLLSWHWCGVTLTKTQQQHQRNNFHWHWIRWLIFPYFPHWRPYTIYRLSFRPLTEGQPCTPTYTKVFLKTQKKSSRINSTISAERNSKSAMLFHWRSIGMSIWSIAVFGFHWILISKCKYEKRTTKNDNKIDSNCLNIFQYEFFHGTF